MTRNRKQPHPAADDPKEELRLQEYIFLGTFTLMIALLVSLYLSLSPVVPVSLSVILIGSTIVLYGKYKDFYKFRDRGQRTWCSVLSLYGSLILTLACALYYSQTEPLTDDYALVFLFGFMFFTFMAYRALSPSMVVGNKRIRIRKK